VTAPAFSVVRFVLVAGLVCAGAACSRADNTPPVATPTFAASKTAVALGSPIELTYKFDVAPDAKIDGDYRVFVHVVDSDGKVQWTPDHDPPIPTSQWKPGQTVGPYTQTVFVPNIAYLGDATVRIGLHKGADRLTLTALDPADRSSSAKEYKVGTLRILPSSENVLIINQTGWHQDEYAQNNPSNSWKWSQKSATVRFRNPRKDSILYLDYDARNDLFPPGQPQSITVYSGDQAVTTFAAGSGQTIQRVPLTAAQLGTAEMAVLRIDVDKTFVPAGLPTGGTDNRELGIRVFHVFLEPKG
jgi:hypothetical protein